MKSIMLLVSLLLHSQISNAQSDIDKSSSAIKIEMLFPEGKHKALILSFDDGNTQDRKLVKLFNNYGLKGTFHLNSNKFDTKGYLSKSEIKSLFKGHEVSVHSANHPALTALSTIDIIYEVVEDRKELEQLTGSIVRGMAYPFGNFNDKVINAITGLGIEYARTVNDTYNFSIPTNYLKWDPSIHQFGRAFFIPNNPENDKKEITAFNKLVDNFVQSDTLALFDLWGHSWENDGDGNRWEAMEEFCKRMSAQKDICSITQIDLVDYINAYKNLKISVDKKHIKNLSSTDVYIKKEDKVIKIPAGVEISI